MLGSLHQIEMTSRCNLRCRYCAHPTMKRTKQDMDEATYAKALKWAQFFVIAGTQRSLNLAGIGESTMHPEFVRNVFLAREAVGDACELVLATNGLLMTDELAQAIAPVQPRVFVSLHRPERAGPAVEALKRAGILAGVSADPSIAATDWAGQIKWHVSAPRNKCPWITGGWVIALSDGRIARCSFDATGDSCIGHVDDDLSLLSTAPHALCHTCHMDVGVPLPQRFEAPVHYRNQIAGGTSVP